MIETGVGAWLGLGLGRGEVVARLRGVLVGCAGSLAVRMCVCCWKVMTAGTGKRRHRSAGMARGDRRQIGGVFGSLLLEPLGCALEPVVSRVGRWVCRHVHSGHSLVRVWHPLASLSETFRLSSGGKSLRCGIVGLGASNSKLSIVEARRPRSEGQVEWQAEPPRLVTRTWRLSRNTTSRRCCGKSAA